MREWELRPLCLALAGLVIGLSLGGAWWHALFLVPLLVLCGSWRSRWVLTGAFLVGVVLHPELNLPLVYEDKPFRGTVDVISVPQNTKTGRASIVSTDVGRLLMYSPRSSQIGMGDKLSLRGMIQPLRDGVVPIRGVVGALRPVGDMTTLEFGSPIWKLGMQIRDGFVATTSARLDETTAGVIDALCFNVTTGLDEDLYEDLRRTGTTHIISTSGVHVIITAGLFIFLLRQLPIPRHWQLALLVLLLLLYAGAAGFRPPIVRAVLMACVGLGSYLVRRDGDGLSAWAGAGLVYLILDPYTVADLSFILSMLAAGGLVLFMGRWEPHEWGWKTWLVKSIQVSFVAWVATLPVLVWVMGDVSLVSVLANLIIDIPVTLIIWSALLAWIISGLFPALAAGVLTEVTTPLANAMLAVVDGMAAWPWASVALPPFSAYWLVPVYAGLLFIWRPNVRKA